MKDLGMTVGFDSLLEDERDYSQYHKNAIHLGWLKKKKIKKNWKKRFVVLLEDRIHYYTHPTQVITTTYQIIRSLIYILIYYSCFRWELSFLFIYDYSLYLYYYYRKFRSVSSLLHI